MPSTKTPGSVAEKVNRNSTASFETRPLGGGRRSLSSPSILLWLKRQPVLEDSLAPVMLSVDFGKVLPFLRQIVGRKDGRYWTRRNARSTVDAFHGSMYNCGSVPNVGSSFRG